MSSIAKTGHITYQRPLPATSPPSQERPAEVRKSYSLVNTRFHRRLKAESILEDRKQRNEETDLTDCLEFADKSSIMVKTKMFYPLFGESPKAARSFLKTVENLRNELAHAQDIISGNWPGMVDLSETIEKALQEAEALATH